MDAKPRHFFEFGPFRVDSIDRVLLKGEEAVPLPPKVFDTLLLLVSHSGRLLEKEELMNQLWAGTFVEDGSLSRNISTLRKVLGDGAKGVQYIQTVPKRGYRFVAQVTEATQENSHTAVSDNSSLDSIAVLPFLDLSPQSDHEYFSDGLTQELINALTKVPGLRVVARTSAFQFKGTALDIRRIGERLNVKTVLEGSVRVENRRLRVTAQLNNVADGFHLWSENYDREMREVFAIQEEIAQSILTTLRIRLSGQSPRQLVSSHTRDMEAYQLYLRGRYFIGVHFKQGINHLERAVALDTNYGSAYAALADAYGLLVSQSLVSTKEGLEKAKQYAKRALEIDETLAEAHSSLGYIRHHEWDWTGATVELQRAIELNPSYAVAHHWYSHHLTSMGRIEESLMASQQALAFDPLDLLINNHLAWHYFYAHQYQLSIEQSQKTVALDANYPRSRMWLAEAYVEMGMYDRAVAELETTLQLTGSGPDYVAALGRAHARAGRHSKARWILKQLTEESRYVSPYGLALIHIGLGENDTAFEWLEKAYAERSSFMTYLLVDPRVNPIRDDPRFPGLLRRIGLVQ